MENQELNLWLLKRLQTESSLRAEEQRLESVRKEYSSERNKYQAARQSFNSTKLRLLSEKEPAQKPSIKYEADKVVSKKLKDDKSKLEEINQRLSNVEGRLKKQSVLVLQNKRKLEVLEERINFIRGRKIAKRNFKEELEILDGKIQQMVIANSKLNRAVKNDLIEIDEVKDEEEKGFSEILQIGVEDRATNVNEYTLNRESGSGPNLLNPDRQNQHEGRGEPSYDAFKSRNSAPNREFYEELSKLSQINYQGEDHLSLRYCSKSGHTFELEIRKDSETGLTIEIRPHRSRDTFNLNASKNEIMQSLREQGFTLNEVRIADYYHGSE